MPTYLTIRLVLPCVPVTLLGGPLGRSWGTAGTERHLRIRARSAAGQVAGAANYQHGLAAHRVRMACPYMFPEGPGSGRSHRTPNTSDQARENTTRASTQFHTGYQRD
jgi:hypothetical protein